MKNTKNNKGITLVALIITIVVLLILAMAGIGAIRDSDIIGHAENAAGRYETEKKDENDIIKYAESILDQYAQDTNNPKIEKTILEKYLFGESPDGRSYLTDLSSDAKNYNEDKELGIAAGDVKGIYDVINLGNEFMMYIEYEGAKYKFKVGFDGQPTNTIPSYGVIRVDDWDSESRVGKYVKDEDNNTWRIIYDDNKNGLQMISTNTYKYNNSEFKLGSDDLLITDWTTLNKEAEEFRLADLNGDGKLEDSYNLERGIYSYNQAVETLNAACENLFKDENGNYTKTYIQDVRCVGSNPIFANKNSENTTPCTSTDVSVLAAWPKNNENQAIGLCDGKGYSMDNNFETDYDRMTVLGINKSSNSYWLASRTVSIGSSYVNFCMRYVASGGSISQNQVWDLYETYANDGGSSNLDFELRPVISLSSGIQFSGEGTETDPYTF